MLHQRNSSATFTCDPVFIVGIYFRKKAVTSNLFLKKKVSSKYPKIKTLRKLPTIRYVSLVLEGFRPAGQTLKPDTIHVLTIFTFNSPPKRRKLSEARQAKAQHRAIVEELFDKGVGDDSSNHEPVRPVTTQDIGIQYNKITN